jgi:hypothetical protein
MSTSSSKVFVEQTKNGLVTPPQIWKGMQKNMSAQVTWCTHAMLHFLHLCTYNFTYTVCMQNFTFFTLLQFNGSTTEQIPALILLKQEQVIFYAVERSLKIVMS